MSLINDALRKARREAAARGERPDAPEVVVILSPKRSLAERPGLVLALGASLVAAVLLGAAGAWWAVHRAAPVDAGAEGAPPAEGPREGAAPARAKTPGGSPAPGETATEPASHERGSLGPTPTPPGRASRRRAPGPPAPGAVPSPTAVPRAVRRAVPTAAAPPEAPPAARREFLGEAKVGGLTLTLDYLVYRPSDPFVQINGVELHQGWEISGFTVKRIQTDRVVLEGPGGTVVIRSR